MSNYKFFGDSTGMVITAMDDYYRVFIPNTNDIFYEDGVVVMTAQEYKDKTISNGDASVYYIMAKDAVTQAMNNPNSLSFPSFTFSSDIGFAKMGDIITVQSYVDTKNAYNAKVRVKWTVQFYYSRLRVTGNIL